jgi:hypothetical protein
MQMMPHISSLWSAAWLPWVLLLCGVLLIGVLISNPRCISDSFSSLFSGLERRYTDTSGVLAMSGLRIFCIAVSALAAEVCLYRGGDFPVRAWLVLLAVVLAVWTGKMLLRKYAAYVFSFESWLRPWREYMRSLWAAVSVVLYVAVAVAALVPVRWLSITLVGAAAALYFVSLSTRLLRTYLISPLSLFYIVIYIITLEVLPLSAVLYAAGRLTSF